MGSQQGKKWDLVDCGHLSSEGSSYDITSWPKGDHNNANDYSGTGECTESSSTCVAEMLACAADNGNGDYYFDWYDPFGRRIFSYSVNAYYACSWIGRFGETNLALEIYRPGRYFCIVDYPGGLDYKFFDIYDQTTHKYLRLSGSNTLSGNSWGAAKGTWAGAQSALSAGNNLYVGEADYSVESGFSFSKSMNIYPTPSFGGYPNNTDPASSFIGGVSGPYLISDVGRPIEIEGSIDRWAYWHATSEPINAKLKIYRGGDAGTFNETTSTLIYTSDSHYETTSGWKTYTISPPQSVLRGDILSLQVDEINLNVGVKNINSVSYYLTSAALRAGDPGDIDLTDLILPGYALMIRAWHTTGEIILPRY
jgi:hypothetical protein